MDIKSVWKDAIKALNTAMSDMGVDPTEVILIVVVVAVVLFLVQKFLKNTILRLLFKVAVIASIMGAVYWGFIRYSAQNIIQSSGGILEKEDLASPSALMEKTKKLLKDAESKEKERYDALKELED